MLLQLWRPEVLHQGVNGSEHPPKALGKFFLASSSYGCPGHPPSLCLPLTGLLPPCVSESEMSLHLFLITRMPIIGFKAQPKSRMKMGCNSEQEGPQTWSPAPPLRSQVHGLKGTWARPEPSAPKPVQLGCLPRAPSSGPGHPGWGHARKATVIALRCI